MSIQTNGCFNRFSCSACFVHLCKNICIVMKGLGSRRQKTECSTNDWTWSFHYFLALQALPSLRMTDIELLRGCLSFMSFAMIDTRSAGTNQTYPPLENSLDFMPRVFHWQGFNRADSCIAYNLVLIRHGEFVHLTLYASSWLQLSFCGESGTGQSGSRC